MVKPIIHVAAIAAALILLSQAGIGIAVSGWYPALIAALIWGLFSLTVRPVLTLLTLPINILTLGLFSFVLNALLFWFIATFVDGFTVAGFVPALIGSVVLAVVSWALHRFS